MTQNSLHSLKFDDFKQIVGDLGMPVFRAKQVWEWVFQKFVFSFDEMTNLSKKDIEKLKERFPTILPPVEKILKDSDGTMKALLKLEDGELIEAVALPEGKNMTFCLSSQVGCSVKCIFCRTGKHGLVRNLTADEIILQVLVLIRKTAQKPTNIVFMGMGEPFHNTREVFKAIDFLTDPKSLAMATRRITISTSGVIEGIAALTNRPGEVNLAVSLHAVEDEARARLVPASKNFSVKKLREAISNYISLSGRRVTFEMVLLKNLNDQLSDAHNLVSFCEGLNCHINIVRFNKFPGCKYEPAPLAMEKEFRKLLKNAGIPVTVRKSKGSEILAACGQLSGKD
jgi:23S rRNA (adenine2503-C2)-methyltransferase